MNTVLLGLKCRTLLVYFNGVVDFSVTIEEHLKRLTYVLQAIRSAALTLQAEQCHLGYEELLFLGYVVSGAGVHSDPGELEADPGELEASFRTSIKFRPHSQTSRV